MSACRICGLPVLDPVFWVTGCGLEHDECHEPVDPSHLAVTKVAIEFDPRRTSE